MDKLTWFDHYSGQSIDELIALEGKYRTDSLVSAVEEAVQEKAKRIGEEQLTDDERIVLAIEELERDVNNGGYDSFFQGPSRQYAPVVVDALKKIGCPAVAALTEKALNALNISGPITAETIYRVLEEDSDERDAKLNECDNQYYHDAVTLTEPLWEYIKRNRSQFDLSAAFS